MEQDLLEEHQLQVFQVGVVVQLVAYTRRVGVVVADGCNCSYVAVLVQEVEEDHVLVAALVVEDLLAAPEGDRQVLEAVSSVIEN